tara:strand:+ start:407 stop:889 length:483 start_codon:yes stop_codon:yes gene_type:complete
MIILSTLSISWLTLPMSHIVQSWIDPGGKTADGKPLFIQGDGKEEPVRKVDYVYGAGPFGWGYYHLLTRNSYGILFPRLQSSMPVVCCCFGTKDARSQHSDHEDVTLIVYNRSVATIPDDRQAARDAIAIARGQAKAIYNMTQNEQLFINGVGLAVASAS